MPMKLSASAIQAMTGEERLAELDRLAAVVFGEKHLAKEVYEDMGTPKPTWARWRKQPESIPTLALLYLQERAILIQASDHLARAAGRSPAGASDPAQEPASR
jgi:hypothetical protein